MTVTAKKEEFTTPVETQLSMPVAPGHAHLLLPESQQIVFDRLVERLQDPSARLVLIGHAGMGKSTLLRELGLRLQSTAHILAPTTPYSSFDDFIEALNTSMGLQDDHEQPTTVENICQTLTGAGTPLVLLIDNALAWPPFLLIELAVLSRSIDLRLVLADRPGLTPHTETLGVEAGDVLELSPLTRTEMDRIAEQRLVNPSTGEPRTLRPGATDRIWYYTGGLPHLASLLCDKLIPGDAEDLDMPVTADQVDIVAAEIGLSEREYLDSISTTTGDIALGEGAPRRQMQATLNHISLIAAGISALAIVSIVVALQYTQPQDLTRDGVVWGDQPVERLAEEFASLGGTLDQPLIELVEKTSAKLIDEPESTLISQVDRNLLANDIIPLLTAEPATETVTASPPAQENVNQQDTVLVALDLTQMLEEAKGHMDALRYTVPAGKNAYEIYARILDKDSSNNQAVDGIKTIHTAYVTWGRDAMKKQEWKKASVHFRKANQVLPGQKETKILLKEAETRVSWLLTFSSLTSSKESPETKEEVKKNDYDWMDDTRNN